MVPKETSCPLDDSVKSNPPAVLSYITTSASCTSAPIGSMKLPPVPSPLMFKVTVASSIAWFIPLANPAQSSVCLPKEPKAGSFIAHSTSPSFAMSNSTEVAA